MKYLKKMEILGLLALTLSFSCMPAMAKESAQNDAVEEWLLKGISMEELVQSKAKLKEKELEEEIEGALLGQSQQAALTEKTEQEPEEVAEEPSFTDGTEHPEDALVQEDSLVEEEKEDSLQIEENQEDLTGGDFTSQEGAQEEGEESVAVFTSAYSGPVLNSYVGTVEGPSGKETYYNLDMSGVVEIMRGMGNMDEYWIREDGCKMLGDYIMCAANLEVHPRGSLVESSLGMCIVCDTGGFAYGNPYQLDIATSW